MAGAEGRVSEIQVLYLSWFLSYSIVISYLLGNALSQETILLLTETAFEVIFFLKIGKLSRKIDNGTKYIAHCFEDLLLTIWVTECG